MKSKVVATNKGNGEITIVPFEQAVKSLQGYWKPDAIEEMLQQGHTLWTPFFEYRLIDYSEHDE